MRVEYSVYEECLEKLGRQDDLKDHLWGRFRATLSAPALRKYLSLLPDFGDVEAEEAALDLAVARHCSWPGPPMRGRRWRAPRSWTGTPFTP